MAAAHDVDMETASDKQGCHLLMVVFHKEVIEKLVVRDVLYYLGGFVSESECLGDKMTPQEECSKFLELLTACGQPGWYQMFLDALNEEGYTYLHTILEMKDTGGIYKFMNKLVSLIFSKLSEVNDVMSVTRDLAAKKHITSIDKQGVLRLCENKGPIRGMQSLLERMIRKKIDWPVHLVDAFMACKLDHFVTMIEPDLLTAAQQNRTREFFEQLAEKNLHGSDPVKLKQMDTFDREQGTSDTQHAGTPQGAGVHELMVVGEECGAGLQGAPSPGERSDDMDGASVVSDYRPESSTVTTEPGEVTSTTTEPGLNITSEPELNITSEPVHLSIHTPSRESASNTQEREVEEAGTDDDDDDFYDANDVSSSNLLHDDDVTRVKHAASMVKNIPDEIQSSIITNDRQPVRDTSPDDQPDVAHMSDLEGDEDEEEEEGVRSTPLVLRKYQSELMEHAIEGKNCVILAPTGTGKTLVAVKIIENHFIKNKADLSVQPKVVFFVPTVALVTQQLKSIKSDLDQSQLGRNLKMKGMSGDSQMNSKDPMKAVITNYDVLVMTPALLMDALKDGEVENVRTFSLIIFDECHHTMKNHFYNQIMAHYLEEKSTLPKKSHFLMPQIVGMTASIGIGQSRKDHEAVEHIMNVCANLDACKLQTVQKNIEELNSFENRPDQDTEEVHCRAWDPFLDRIKEVMEKIETKMQTYRESKLVQASLLLPPADRGCDSYTQWLSRLKKPVAEIHDQTMRRVFFACTAHLRMYNNALLINADCRTKDALKYITAEFEKFNAASAQQKDHTDTWLMDLYQEHKAILERNSEDKRADNPKLTRLGQIILENKHPDMRAIVFCKTRELTHALQSWMQENESLKDLNARALTGTNAHTEKKGMTLTNQQDVLKFFKGGEHKVIVATSVAEEGLDIQKCDLVIRYIHVTNMVAHVQARGRARAESAKFVTVGDSLTAMRDRVNSMREEIQDQAIRKIQNMSSERFNNAIQVLQREAKIERDMANSGRMVEAAMRANNVRMSVFELRCSKCNQFAVFTSEIRTVRNAHHVVVDGDFVNKVKIVPHPNPKAYDGWLKTGKLYCVKCNLDWGIKALYKKIPFHVIKIESFVVISEHGQRDVFTKWKKTPFHLEELSTEDMEQQAMETMNAIDN